MIRERTQGWPPVGASERPLGFEDPLQRMLGATSNRPLHETGTGYVQRLSERTPGGAVFVVPDVYGGGLVVGTGCGWDS
jgi:hypothetical protein